MSSSVQLDDQQLPVTQVFIVSDALELDEQYIMEEDELNYCLNRALLFHPENNQEHVEIVADDQFIDIYNSFSSESRSFGRVESLQPWQMDYSFVKVQPCSVQTIYRSSRQ